MFRIQPYSFSFWRGGWLVVLSSPEHVWGRAEWEYLTLAPLSSRGNPCHHHCCCQCSGNTRPPEHTRSHAAFSCTQKQFRWEQSCRHGYLFVEIGSSYLSILVGYMLKICHPKEIIDCINVVLELRRTY